MARWNNRGMSYQQQKELREIEAFSSMERRQQLNERNAQLRSEDYTRQAGMAHLTVLVAQADNRQLSANAATARALALQSVPTVTSKPEMFRFVVGTRSMETAIAEQFTLQEWDACDDLPPNMSWEHITTRTEEDAHAWIAAKNRYLCAAWTPNQDEEERAENKIIMNEALAEMVRLEISV